MIHARTKGACRGAVILYLVLALVSCVEFSIYFNSV